MGCWCRGREMDEKGGVSGRLVRDGAPSRRLSFVLTLVSYLGDCIPLGDYHSAVCKRIVAAGKPPVPTTLECYRHCQLSMLR